MYKAVLQYKDGRFKEMILKNLDDVIYLAETEELTYNVAEFIDLTPENIIKHSGFSERPTLKNFKKTEFLLDLSYFDSKNERYFYFEV